MCPINGLNDNQPFCFRPIVPHRHQFRRYYRLSLNFNLKTRIQIFDRYLENAIIFDSVVKDKKYIDVNVSAFDHVTREVLLIKLYGLQIYIFRQFRLKRPPKLITYLSVFAL